MKFPRNARIFTGRMDAAPFAGVFFLLVLFILLGSLVYTPGVAIRLPVDDQMPGTDQPTVSVAVDPNGQLYFDNQIIPAAQLKSRLAAAARKSPEPLALLVQADKAVNYETLIRVAAIARDAGIKQAFLATAPGDATAAEPPPRP